jgi:hypothetical protein
MDDDNLEVRMEKIGYLLLGVVAAVWIGAVAFGVIATMPVGLVGLAAILGIGILFIKVLKERIESKEDDYYEKNIKD